MRRPITLVLGMTLLSLSVAATGARAEGTRAEEVSASNRALDGHVFLPSAFLTGPFSTTHVGESSLYAVADGTGPKYNLQGQVVGERNYSLAGFGNSIQYQYRFADWMAVRANLNVVIYSGIDGISVAAAGATFRGSGGLGLTAGLPLGRTVRLAFVGDLGFAPAMDLTIAAGIRRAIATQNFDSGEVFVLGRTIEARPGVSVAWAPIPLVGVQGEVRYVYTNVEKTSSEEASGDSVNFVGQVDLDFATISSVPIGLLALYRQQKPVGGDTFRFQDLGAGLYYTGRPHLAVGLNVTAQWFHLRPEIDAKATIADVLVRYYW